ncbi:unnamed protein product, partial [Laminaria digitata]
VFPEEYEIFLSYLSFVNFDIGVVVSYSCLFSPNFYGRLLVTTITPLLVLMILSLTYYFTKRRYRDSPQGIFTVRRRHLSAGLFVLFFVYSSVSSAIFQTFSCEDLEVGSSLIADHSVLCQTWLHNAYMIYACLMITIYPIGIPSFFTWWLVRNRKYLKTSDRQTIVHLQPFGGVWSTYSPSRYYYEVVEYVRRLTLSLSSVFLAPDSVNQIAVVLGLASVFLFVSESLSPFESSTDMSLYRWGNGVIMASMFLALLVKADTSSDESLSVFGWVLIVANILMIVAVVVEAVFL